MFYSLTGNVLHSGLSYIVIECGGVGFMVQTSNNTLFDISGEKTATGYTMSEYITTLKVKEAKKLIRQGLSFSAISQSLYFDSVAHFNETFKKITGMTPGEYKKSIK